MGKAIDFDEKMTGIYTDCLIIRYNEIDETYLIKFLSGKIEWIHKL